MIAMKNTGAAMLYIDLPHAFIATTSLCDDILPNTSSMPVSIPIGSA